MIDTDKHIKIHVYPTDNRFSDALGIWSGGACNVSGIARSLVKAADAARADGVQPCEDLAVRAIVAQLAWLCKVDAIGGVGGVVDIESALREKGGV